MYYPDLSRYEYSTDPDGEPQAVFNVGWLGRGHAFPTGPIPPGLLNALFLLARRPVNVTRGWQRCAFCAPTAPYPIQVTRDGTTLRLGGAELQAVGRDRAVYAAPDLVYHYVEAHSYRPPIPFIDAVRSS